MDGGYQGLANDVRAVLSTRIFPNGVLAQADQNQSQQISSDCVVVKRFCGLNCSWNVHMCKFVWDRERFDRVFKICAPLTNFHINLHPLMEQDEVYYSGVLTELWVIAEKLDCEMRKSQAHSHHAAKHRRQAFQLKFGGVAAV